LLIGTGEYARDGSAAKQPTDDPAVFLRGVVSRIADNGYGAGAAAHPSTRRATLS
jgi:hypothetical protein